VWSQWYPEYAKARTAAGFWDLNQALSLSPQYSDAMAYMNLLVRERADLRDTAEEYRRDITEADQWVQRALEAKRTGSAQPNGTVAAPPPPPPPPPPGGGSGAPSRIRVGANVQQANLVSQVPPVYPPLARQAKIEGVVRLSAIIDKEGLVAHLEVISGHPLLVPAALEAVKQWVYKPTLLNGQPVEVATQLDVNFTLSQ
jgi:TonB family protein